MVCGCLDVRWMIERRAHARANTTGGRHRCCAEVAPPLPPPLPPSLPHSSCATCGVTVFHYRPAVPGHLATAIHYLMKCRGCDLYIA